MRAKKIVKQGLILTVALLALVVSGCGAKRIQPEKRLTKSVYKVVSTQKPLAPIYNRTRWAHLPSVMPASAVNSSPSKAPRIFPVIELVLENDSLETAATIIAGTARYSSYCSSHIADDTITLTALGTIDELADRVAQEAGITVSVDHENREVRFVANSSTVQPEFFESTLDNEQKETNGN